MRALTLPLLAISLLTGCGPLERFDAAENRINAARPPDSGVQAARQLLLAQTADQPDAQPLWTARLRLRALACSQDYTPTWRDSRADILARLNNKDCFAEGDRALQRWIGLQRTRLMLAQGPIRPAPDKLPPMITHRESIQTVIASRAAPVAILRGNNGFDVVDLSDGKSLFHEDDSQAYRQLMTLSPNGRVFTQAGSGKAAIRATEGGETLLELPKTDTLVWLDSNVAVVRSGSVQNLKLLDLTTGEETALPGVPNDSDIRAYPVPGAPGRFDLVSYNKAFQVEIVTSGGRRDAKLLTERRTSGAAFASTTGGVSADGAMWVGGSQQVNLLNLDTLAVEERSFKPVTTQTAWPTANPQEFVLSMGLPSGDGVSTHFNYYVYNLAAATLALIQREPGSSTHYHYIDSIKRLALIDNQSIRYIDKLQAGTAQPVDAVVAAFIEEMNQRRLAAAVLQSAAPDFPSTGGDTSGHAERPRGYKLMPLPFSEETTASQAQLRETQIEGVGVYAGAGARHGSGQARTPGFVEVRVRRSSRPVTLVLSSYEPVRWRVTLEPGARLAAVLLGGYHESTVSGAGTARVYQIGREYAYEQPSREYAALQRNVMRWTGKPMAVFQGRYEGSAFSVGSGL